MSVAPPGYETPYASPPQPPPAPQEAPLSHKDANATAAAAKAYAKAQRPYKMKRWWAAGLLLLAIIGVARGGTNAHDSQLTVSHNTTQPAQSEASAAAKPAAAKDPVVMPDVTSKRLDVAKSAVHDAGFDGEVKVDGGGALGVVDESNWDVCEQSPAAGETVSDSPRLTVDRSCDNAKPSETPKPSTTPSQTSKPDTTESSQPTAEQVLTADNSQSFKALLAVPDYCDQTIAPFVAKFRDRTIGFDGSIVKMVHNGDYDTRFDILVAPGSKGPESTVGPDFKFEDVNVVTDLHLSGPNIPDYVGEGDRFHFVAQIVDYNPDQCLLFLKPVSTTGRA